MIPLGEDDGLHRSWWRMLLGLLDDEATRRCRLSGHADAVFAELGPRWHMCEPSGGGPPPLRSSPFFRDLADGPRGNVF